MTKKPARRVLIVGAGAVGQVYGYHLSRGGASVTFFVKEKYRSDLESGTTLYWLNSGTDPIQWSEFGVASSLDAVSEQRWDQVWLCVSSTALNGEWLAPFLKRIESAALVALQPGFATRSLLTAIYPSELLVSGLINMISYQSPLPGEDSGIEGIAYWFPPGGKQIFSGEAGPTREVVADLRAGKCPAKRVRDAAYQTAVGSAFLMPLIASLESADWSFEKLKERGRLRLAVQAAREAMLIVADHFEEPPPWLRHAVSVPLLRLVMKLAPRVCPLNIEVYLKYHFLKVREQTQSLMEGYIELGHSKQRPVQSLETLAMRLFS